MNPILQANIFFFITSVAVVIGGVLISILLIYAILIFRDIRLISGRVKQETELIAMDIEAAREHLKKHEEDFTSIFGFLKGIFNLRRKKKS